VKTQNNNNIFSYLPIFFLLHQFSIHLLQHSQKHFDNNEVTFYLESKAVSIKIYSQLYFVSSDSLLHHMQPNLPIHTQEIKNITLGLLLLTANM
jgi:hypothetical protein